MRAALWLLVAMLAAGCANTERILRLGPDPKASGRGIFWPGPPEIPRYRYAGVITGESNYVEPGTDGRSKLRTALEWIAGLAAGSAPPDELLRPNAITTDASGRVLVTDASRQAVVVFDPARGMQAWEQASGLTKFVTPAGVATAPDGRAFVTDADLAAVYVLSREGEPLRVIGKGLLKRPTGIAYDAARSRVYVVDTQAHDIKVFDGEGALLATLGRRGEGDGELNFPTHVALAQGELYVTDTMNSRIQVLAPDTGAARRSIGTRGLYVGNLVRPKGVSVDSEGNVYVVESYYDRLLVYDRQGRFLMPIGGLGKDVGQFYLPSGVWTDAMNRIYVADMFNGRIVVLQFLGGDNGEGAAVPLASAPAAATTARPAK